MNEETDRMTDLDYEPLNITPIANAGIDVLGSQRPGHVDLRGIPFAIGGAAPSSERCVIALDDRAPRHTVPVGRRTRWVVFAHRQLSRANGPWGVGNVVATYRLVLADGSRIEAPVRERFEIQVIDAEWGDMPSGVPPFLALPDQNDALQDRFEGPFGAAGRRQCEFAQGPAKAFYLWAWRVPDPATVIESIELEAGASPVVIGAITLGHLDEEPFTRSPLREVRLLVDRPRPGISADQLSVSIDRGVAGYVQPLPVADPGEFLQGPHVESGFPGWGEALNPSASPAYVAISASASATVRIHDGDDELGAIRWGDVERDGAADGDHVRVELLDRGRNWVHVTVVDDATGHPVPCRLHFRTPEGVPYQPHGHPTHLNSNLDTWHFDVGGDVRLGHMTYAYIDGKCQGWLPRGDVIAEVARGYEYEPIRQLVQIQPGQRELTLRIRRWINMAERGWYSGDSHVHFLSTQGALLEQQGEDLNVVNLLQGQWGALFTNTEDFSRGPAIAGEGKYVTQVSQENRQHILGHLTMLGLTEPVTPWSSDGPREAELGGTLEATLSNWADEARAQGATIVIPHFPNPNGEPATLIATGRADAIEMLRSDPELHHEYYRYLNCGYRLPLVGGTDKMSAAVPVGLYRTYAYLGNDEGFSYDAWTRAVREGRTFLSSGPMLHFEVEGHEIGDTVQMTGPGTLHVNAWAESTIPIYTLEIIQHGKVVASVEHPTGTRRFEIDETVRIDRNSWIVARCGGPGGAKATYPTHLDEWRRGVFAHTSPVYVQVGRDPWHLFDPEVASYMRHLVQGSLAHVEQASRQHPAGSVTHHHGHHDHMAYLTRPFHEALKTLDRRIGHQH